MDSHDTPGKYTVIATYEGTMVHNTGCISMAEVKTLRRAWEAEGFSVEVIVGKWPND